MPGQALQLLTHVDQAADPVVLVVGLLEFRILAQCLVQRHIELCGHHLGDAVHKSVRQIHDAPHVADDALGRQRSEGDDLHDSVTPVLAGDIVDDFAPSLEAEVHVDIGHGHALWIKKTLEQKVIFDGIDVCNMQAIRHNAARGAASSGADHDIVLP